MMSPVISVVVPSLNQGRFLANCLDSAIAQADEVLLLDAGSTDESLHYAFDWDWFLRAAKICRFIRIDTTVPGIGSA